MHDDGAAHEVNAVFRLGELQLQPAETDGVVSLHDAIVLDREKHRQVDANHRDEGAIGLLRLDGEPPIEVGDEVLFEVPVCSFVVGDLSGAELLRQPTLDGL